MELPGREPLSISSPEVSSSIPDLVSDTESSVSTSPPDTPKDEENFAKFFSDQDRQILCRMTGLKRDTNFQDLHLWLRVLFRFLLDYCEGFCNYLGKAFWTHRQHQLVPQLNDNIALVRYLRLFSLEPHEKIHTNTYLHPSERNSAYQCLQFLKQGQRLTTIPKEESEVRLLLEYLCGARADNEATAGMVNFQRLRGEFGPPGHYPHPSLGVPPMLQIEKPGTLWDYSNDEDHAMTESEYPDSL